jgi:hypothetical protein
LKEELADGQRIDGYRIVAEPDGRELAWGTTIGSQAFVVMDEVQITRLRIEVGSTGGRLTSVTAHLTGHGELPTWETPGQQQASMA